MTPREFGDRAFEMAFTVMDEFKKPRDHGNIGCKCSLCGAETSHPDGDIFGHEATCLVSRLVAIAIDVPVAMMHDVTLGLEEMGLTDD